MFLELRLNAVYRPRDCSVRVIIVFLERRMPAKRDHPRNDRDFNQHPHKPRLTENVGSDQSKIVVALHFAMDLITNTRRLSRMVPEKLPLYYSGSKFETLQL